MITDISQGVQDNLRFLIAEVSSQLTNLQIYFETNSVTVAQLILDRSGYAHNLKTRIHESCLDLIAKRHETQLDPLLLRSLESVATDIDRIAELCRDCIHQMEQLKKRHVIQQKRYLPLLRKVTKGVRMIESAVKERDTATALKIGSIKRKLDRGYGKLFTHYTHALKHKKQPQDLIIALFVAHCVEQMGEALLNISEALITAQLGLPLNTTQFQSLQATLGQLNAGQLNGQPLEALSIESIAETRSGSGISGISNSNDDTDGYDAIYKDGSKRKLKEERQGVESWHEIYPGIAPRIISYHKQGKSASMLIEHLPGFTLEQILLYESPNHLKAALKQLKRTLRSVWQETRAKQAVSANHMQQLTKRLESVYSIHPKFHQGECAIDGHSICAFDQLVNQAIVYEANIKAPFSVYIHGDFNLDNIIFDPAERRINFIDLHRSQHTDYVQDISVFMVSCYRLQILDRPLRQRSMELVIDFHRFASDFARKSGDREFELRLALGLARSFITSTRFILDRSLANNMFLRARYLLERVLETPVKQTHRFKLPIQEIFSV